MEAAGMAMKIRWYVGLPRNSPRDYPSRERLGQAVQVTGVAPGSASTKSEIKTKPLKRKIGSLRPPAVRHCVALDSVPISHAEQDLHVATEFVE